MSENLTPKQRMALESYVLTGSATEAASAGGVSRLTFYTWRELPAFVAELRRLDGDALQNLGRRVMALSGAACKALADALANDQPIGIRLRAAAIVTEKGPALAELSALIERVQALEASYAQQS
jgi:hypothetical protein